MTDFINAHVHQLKQGHFTGEGVFAIGHFPKLVMVTFNRIGGVNDFSDRRLIDLGWIGLIERNLGLPTAMIKCKNLNNNKNNNKKTAILVLVLPRIPPPLFGPAVDDMLFADLANCVGQMYDTT